MAPNLITPAQAIASAFASDGFLPETCITQQTIALAQQRYLEPVFGNALLEKLAAGHYSELLERWIAPALARYVRLLMLPELAVHVSGAGVSAPRSARFAPAEGAALRRALRRTRADAASLVRCAVACIEADAGRYPEYDARRNVLNRCRIEGQLVL